MDWDVFKWLQYLTIFCFQAKISVARLSRQELSINPPLLQHPLRFLLKRQLPDTTWIHCFSQVRLSYSASADLDWHLTTEVLPGVLGGQMSVLVLSPLCPWDCLLSVDFSAGMSSISFKLLSLLGFFFAEMSTQSHFHERWSVWLC